MARITIAQLQAQLAEERAYNEAAHRGLTETIDDLRAQVAELEARLARGHGMVKALRAENDVLREQLAAKPRAVIVRPRPAEAKPVVTRFYRGGQLWEKTRVGNHATERLVEEAAA